MEFEITQQMVQNLLGYVKKGFCNGAGEVSDGQFCVQQAVNMATTMEAETSDGPNCVHKEFNCLGINLNDMEWRGPKTRAKGLKRLAVAEMGTEEWSADKIRKFKTMFRERLGIIATFRCSDIATLAQEYLARHDETDEERSKVANIAANIIQELGSQGAQYLYLCDKKMGVEDARKLAREECAKHNQVYFHRQSLGQPGSFTGCSMKFNAKGGFKSCM